MALVSIVMGSDSDMPVMAKAAGTLEEFGISFEMRIISAHREPELFFDYARTAEDRGVKVIIAGAGMAAHLPGMCAALFTLPVIGVPMHTASLGERIPCTRLCRCRPGYRWRQWRSAAQKMLPYWPQKSWRFQTTESGKS